MNIFVISDNVVECAQALDDRRLRKMILETMQLLSTTVNALGGKGPYKTTHLNHPASKWARRRSTHYSWLLTYISALDVEYKRRFNKQHKSALHIKELPTADKLFDKQANTIKFWNITIYKQLPTFEAYKAYLNMKWKTDGSLAKWTNSNPPSWRKE